MSFTLESLFYHGVFPFEQAVPKDPKYRQINHALDKEHHYLAEKLAPEDVAHLDAMEDLCAESSMLYGCACFAYSFRLAAQLLTESLTNEQK